MNRKMIPVAGVLLAAVFFSPRSYRTGEKPSSRTATVSASGSAATPAKPATPDSLRLIARQELGPWNAACDFFAGPERSPAVAIDLIHPADKQVSALRASQHGKPAAICDSDAACKKLSEQEPQSPTDPWCVRSSGYKLQFLIATVPDPVNTHLALDFDRRIEAIQWAAQDSGYLNDSFWLPWDTSEAKQTDPSKKRENLMLRQMREEQPGLQIFRGSQGSTALFVFVVAETPTMGVNKSQLANALNYVRDISLASNSTLPPELPVLGPSFSGSVKSLSDVLALADYQSMKFHLISGSATNRGSLDKLRSQAPHVHFEQVLHDDDAALGLFLGYAKNNLGIEPWQVAVLSESATAYGVKADQTSTSARGSDIEKIHQFRFPREISALRSAYPDQPVIPVPQNAGTAPVVGLTLDLKQTLGDTDDVPALSEAELPMSQEAVLLDITSAIKRAKVKLVGIRATDVFDMLFLARFLREFTPDVRLFLLDSDLLLVRATDSIPLDGTLAISDYPLIPGSASWFQPNNCSNRHVTGPPLIFPSRYSEATYNAFRALMGEPECMQDYAAPRCAKEPPLWLTVVGRNGYWPVALLAPDQVSQAPAAPAEAPKFVATARNEIRFRPGPPSGGYLLLCSLVAIVSLIQAWCFHAASATTVGQMDWLLEFLHAGPESERRSQKAFFWVCATLILATLDFIIFLPVWVGYWTSQWKPSPWYLSMIGAGIAVTAVTIAGALRIHHKYLGLDQHEGKIVWLAWAVFLAFYGGWLWFVLGRSSDANSFFWYRSFDLAGGTSPILPPLFVLIALYVCSWTQVRRVRFWESRRPLVPSLPLDDRYRAGFAGLEKSISAGTGNLYFVKIAGYALLFLVMAGPFVLRLQSHIAGFEAFSIRGWNGFDWLYIATLVLLYGVMFADWTRFLVVWSAMRKLLRRLERQPLRKAFDRLPKKYYSWTPLWHSGGNRRTFTILMRALECLRKLQNTQTAAKLPELADDLHTLEAKVGRLFYAESKDVLDMSRQIRECQYVLRSAGNHLLTRLLIPYWDHIGGSESVEEANGPAKSDGDSGQRYLLRGHAPEPVRDDTKEAVEIAEEFVALRFIALLRYVGLQLRNQLSFVSTAFILSLISLHSYPFQSHRTIGWTLTTIFVVLSAGVVMCFAQMDQDAILSRISDTEPGKLDREFYRRVISYGALPLLTVLASQFPQIGRFLFSWVQPAVDAMH